MFRRFTVIFMIIAIAAFMGCAKIEMVLHNPFPDRELSYACQGQPLLQHAYSGMYDGFLIAKCGPLYFIHKAEQNKIPRRKSIVLNKNTRMLVRYESEYGYSLHSYASLVETELTRGRSIHTEKWHDFDDDITKININHVKVLWQEVMTSLHLSARVPIINAYQYKVGMPEPSPNKIYSKMAFERIHSAYIRGITHVDVPVPLQRMVFRLYYASFSPDTIKKERWFKESIKQQNKFSDIPHYFSEEYSSVIAANTLIQPSSTLDKFAADLAQIGEPADLTKQRTLWCKYLDVDARYCAPN